MMLRQFVQRGLVAAVVLGASSSLWAQDDMGTDAAPTEESADVKPEETSTADVAMDNDSGTTRNWRVGPTFNVAIVPPTVGVDVMYKNQFSGGFHMGPFTYKSDDVDVKFNSWDIVGRWHPMQGSFFVGLGYVSQSLDLEASKKMDAGAAQKIDTTLKVGVTTNYMMPHIGFMSVWDSGFTLGFEIGYKIHSSHSTDKLKANFDGATAGQVAAVISSSEYKKLEKNVNDAAEKFGETNMPYINLLKIGYLF